MGKVKVGEEIDQKVINTIRFLSLDMVERAKSGHPGMPLGASQIPYIIFDRFLKFNPKNPKWINRDRFILSAGHASAMLYATLYLFGYDLTLEDLKNFRQLNSKTPGHPESFKTPGVEATTGPLGQGIGNGVGIALGEKLLSLLFNKEGYPIIDHYTYVLCSDGDIMEGISSEVGQLAGHWKLNKLIVLWDNNGISIDGPTSLAWSEDVLKRFEAFGWQVLRVEDGYNLKELTEAIELARESKEKPTFIEVRTHIGYGSPLQDSEKVHGAPMGRERALETKRRANWPLEEFYVPEEVLKYTRRHVQLGEEREREWKKLFEEYSQKYPELAQELLRAFKKEWSYKSLKNLKFEGEMATRKASGVVLNLLAKENKTLVGGSADLSESTHTLLREFPERTIHFGVREHAMGAILNGLSYHGAFLPFGGTFLIFSDYMRPSIRMACLSRLQVLYIFTHDSIFLGEDGPTHQPIEQLPSLRDIPNLYVLRPADANEVKVAYEIALERKEGPTAIILTRQKLPTLDRSIYPKEENAKRGFYILEEDPEPELLILASGSEVHPAIEAKKLLNKEGIRVRLVNAFSFELFEEQDKDYKERILEGVKYRVCVEASSERKWHRYVGREGLVIGIWEFGRSAPYKELAKFYGFTGEGIYKRIKEHFGF